MRSKLVREGVDVEGEFVEFKETPFIKRLVNVYKRNSKMDQKTQIKILKNQISLLESKIRDIKDNCRHENYLLKTEETFSFDVQLVHQCEICFKKAERELSFKEKEDFWRKELSEEEELLISEEELLKIIEEGGYNYER